MLEAVLQHSGLENRRAYITKRTAEGLHRMFHAFGRSPVHQSGLTSRPSFGFDNSDIADMPSRLLAATALDFGDPQEIFDHITAQGDGTVDKLAAISQTDFYECLAIVDGSRLIKVIPV